MKATESKINEFLATPKTRFVIPIYQRNYDWQDHQCSQLYSDICNVAKDESRQSHFVGSIVYLQDGVYSASDVKELVVIDGQQRLTTLSLVYIALYQFAEGHGLEEEAAELKETYLINRFVKDRQEKLWQTEENDRIYQRLIRNQSEEGESFSRIRENFAYFKELIRDEAAYRMVKEGMGKLSFVDISLERGKDDPQRIFESLNSTGLALSQADLIRNYILMGHVREEQGRLYIEYWKEIEKNARDDESRTNLVSDFARDMLTFKNKRIPRKNLVYDTFKIRFPEREKKEVESLLKEMRRYSEYFGKLTNPTREADVQIRLELEYIRQLEINVSYPFLLQVYDDYQTAVINKEEFISVLQLIQRFAWRRFLVNLPTNALNKIFMRLYEEVRQDDYIPSLERAIVRKKGTQRMPTDAEVKSSLRERDFYNIRSKNRSYYLDRLENHNNRERVATDHLTVEHIFPQKPTPAWKKSLMMEDYEAFQDKHLHQLGNLTLSGNNGSLSNRAFKEKKTLNTGGKEQGYAFSRLWLNRDLMKLDTWTVADFKTRHNRLIKRTLEIWPYPEVEVMEDVGTQDEMTIFEIDDPTGYKVKYAKIGTETIEPKSVKEFYITVLSRLFAGNPNPMMQPEVSGTILLERNDPNAFDNEHIGRGYSVDASNSSWVKFKRLETVLNAYDLEDFVRVKLVEA
jgi:uncharacterized protein with ParB-like and HNH nuclease domain